MASISSRNLSAKDRAFFFSFTTAGDRSIARDKF
jgi:hypothetical protein